MSPNEVRGTLSHRDGGWSLCASCGQPRTWSGPVDPGCDCSGEGAMVVTYEEGDFTITGAMYRDAAGKPVSPYVFMDLTTREEIDAMMSAATVAPQIIALGTSAAPSDLFRYAAMIEGRKDAIREALDLVPTPVIEEARPMNRAQRRAKMRRGGR